MLSGRLEGFVGGVVLSAAHVGGRHVQHCFPETVGGLLGDAGLPRPAWSSEERGVVRLARSDGAEYG